MIDTRDPSNDYEYEVFEASTWFRQKWRWRFMSARNGEIMAQSSEAYTNWTDMWKCLKANRGANTYPIFQIKSNGQRERLSPFKDDK